MRNRYKEFLIVIIFALISIFIFRNYFINNTVPFPANLLVAFYQPWASYDWKGYPSGPPNKPIGFDNLRIFYPIRSIAIDSIKNFSVPLWNPYYFSGNTLLATYQSAIFHPLSFLFLLLPQIDAWSAIVILTPFLSSLFMYIFLKELNLGRKASFFGAVVFAFSGFMVVWWEESFMSSYSALFLPLILYGIKKSFKKIDLLSFSCIVFGLAFSILSGWFQMSFYVFIFSFLWIIYLFLTKQGKFINFIFVLESCILAIFISSIHLFPSIEAYIYSARGSADVKFLFNEYLVPLSHLVTLISPDFFGNPGAYNYFGTGFYYEKVIYLGIPGLLFGLYSFLFRGEKYANFFKLTFIICFSLGFSLATSWFLLYNFKFPFLSTIIPSRIFFLSTFCLSVLSAFGLESYLGKKIEKKRLLLLVEVFGIIVFLLWDFIISNKNIKEIATVSKNNLYLPTLLYFFTAGTVFLGIRINHLKKYTFFLLTVISLFGSIYFVNKYLYFSERKFLFSEIPVISKLKEVSGNKRVWSSGHGYIDKNLLMQYKIQSPEGYDSFYIKRYGELLFAAQNKGIFNSQIPRADANLGNILELENILKDPYRERLMKLLSVTYFVSKKDGMKDLDSRFDKIWSDNNFALYRYNESFPRVFLVDNYVLAIDNQEILNKLFEKNMNPRRTIILEEFPSFPKDSKILKGNTEIVNYASNEIKIKSDSNKSALLFLSDNFYLGWNAYIDGQKTKIYRANYTFRSIVVPKGSHMVVFKYEPLSFKIGLAMTLFGMILFILSLGFIKLKNRKI